MKSDDLKKIGNALGWTDFRIIDNMFPVLIGIHPDDFSESAFNPVENMGQLADCEEWLLSKDFAVEINKFISNYTVRLSKVGSFGFSEGKTKAEALLNEMLGVIENAKL